MKSVLLTIIILLLGTSAWTQTFAEHLIPYQKEGMWGYINSTKEVVIEPEYDEVHFFSVRLGTEKGFYACVRKGESYGLIDSTGKVVVVPGFTKIEDGYVATDEGNVGIAYRNEERYFLYSGGRVSQELEGKSQGFCATGRGSHCWMYPKPNNWGQQAVPSDNYYQFTVLDTLIEGNRRSYRFDTIGMTLDSTHNFGTDAAMVLYRPDGKLAFAQPITGRKKRFYAFTNFVYDEFKVIDCEEGSFKGACESIFRTRKGDYWGLTDLSHYQSSIYGLDALLIKDVIAHRYLNISNQKRGDFYLVEHTAGQWGYVHLSRAGKITEYW